jgi:hypothetical protein
MRAQRLFSVAVAVLGAAALAGCQLPPNLIAHPITRQHAGWRATLVRLDDGPNIIRPSGWTAHYAGLNRRLLHATFEITNTALIPRSFSYARCVMALGDLAAAPGLVTTRSGIWMAIADIESYGPGESSTRMLTYSYPLVESPTRLDCPGMRFDLTPDAPPTAPAVAATAAIPAPWATAPPPTEPGGR